MLLSASPPLTRSPQTYLKPKENSCCLAKSVLAWRTHVSSCLYPVWGERLHSVCSATLFPSAPRCHLSRPSLSILSTFSYPWSFIVW